MMKRRQNDKRAPRRTRIQTSVEDSFSQHVAPLLSPKSSTFSLKSFTSNKSFRRVESNQSLLSQGQKRNGNSPNQGLPTANPLFDEVNVEKNLGENQGQIENLHQEEQVVITGHDEEAKEIRVQLGCWSLEGPYHENEDRVTYNIGLNKYVDAYLGIFDGHGGFYCAEYISEVMSTHILENFTSDETWVKGETVLKDMFHDVEMEFSEFAREEADTSGACATVLLVNGYEVIVANIGDCRAVAYSDGKVTVLTEDHRADSPSELLRINLAGGNVVNGRVFNLQPSRSFGDWDVKDVAGENVVIPTPEVCKFAFKPTDSSQKKSAKVCNKFLIVATDGLWDSVANNVAVDLCKDVLEKNYSNECRAELAAEELVKLAVKNRSTDDITVAVVVWE